MKDDLRNAETVRKEKQDAEFKNIAMTDIEKLLAPRRVKWKRVKQLAPHCPVCDEQLSGNNSSFTPYRCSCGEWEGDWQHPQIYKIKVKAL